MRNTIVDGRIRSFRGFGNMLLVSFGGRFVSVHFIVLIINLHFWLSYVVFLVVT